jgi:integrase
LHIHFEQRLSHVLNGLSTGNYHKRTPLGQFGLTFRSHLWYFKTGYDRRRDRWRIGIWMRGHRPFTISELKSLLEIATPEWQSLVKFGLYTGQRLEDIAWLTWSNIDTKRGEIRLLTRKRDKTILIPIAGPLQNHILSLPTSDDPKSPIHPEAYGVRVDDLHRRRRAAGFWAPSRRFR